MERGLRYTHIAGALGEFVLGGCSSMIPRYERPAAPIPASYAQEMTPAASAGSVAAADLEWARFFADPRLRRLIEIALANNRDLRVAVLNIEQTRALYDVRRADELPSVGVGGTVSRQPGTTGKLVNTYAVGFAVTGCRTSSGAEPGGRAGNTRPSGRAGSTRPRGRTGKIDPCRA